MHHTKVHFSSITSVLVCDRTSTISYSMFFKAILKFLEILVGNSLFVYEWTVRILVSVST